VNRHQFLAAVGAMNFVKAFARHLEGLRGGGVLERQADASRPARYVDGGAAIFGRAQLDVGIHRDIGGTILLAAQIARGLFDERNKGACSGRSFEMLSKVEVNTITRPSPTCFSSSSGA
jgi:hypothetical protein